MDQDAIIVKTVSKVPGISGGITRVPDGLSGERPQFDPSKYFNVIKGNSAPKDESVNDRIMREGAHQENRSGTVDQPLLGGEVEWYMKHKGYSQNV